MAGVAAGMSKIQAIGTTVEGLSAKLDASASGIAALQATCKQLLSAVQDLQKRAAARGEPWPPHIHTSTQTEHPSSPPAAQKHQQSSSGGACAPLQRCLKVQAAGLQGPNAAAGQLEQTDQPQKVGRLTAMFRAQKPCKPPLGINAYAQQSRPPAKHLDLQDGPAAHAGPDSRPTTGKQAHQALVEGPLKAARVSPTASPRWRRKGGAAAHDSGFDSPEQAPVLTRAGATARKAAAAAHKSGARNGAPPHPAAQAAMRPDREQSLPAASQPADAPATSSLHLTLQLPRDTCFTAKAPDMQQPSRPPLRGSAVKSSRKKLPAADGPEHAAAAAAQRTKTGAKQRPQEEMHYTRRPATARQTQPTACAAAMDDDPFAALFSRAADTGDNILKEGSSSASCNAGQLDIDQAQIAREVKMHMQRMRASRQKRVREE